MPVAESLLLEVGSQVANHVVRLWLKHERRPQADPATVAEILTQALPSTLQRRRTNRQLDQLAERVASKLEPFIEVEFASLADDEKAAALVAIATVLGQAELTLDELLDADLEPAAIEKHVRVRADEPVGLSEGSRELYRVLLRETTAYIADLVTRLPRFTPIALQELLQRDGRLIDLLQGILDALPAAGTGAAADAAVTFEYDYRRALLWKLDRLELFGVTLSDVTRRYALSLAYITLTVTSRFSEARHQPIQRAGEEARARREFPRDDDHGQRVVRVDDALRRTRRMLIRGEAGSGKTTLLQWLAVMASGQRFDRDGPLGAWNEAVPFFLQLRRYVNVALPAPEAFLGHVVPQLSGGAPHGWVHQQLKTGRALVLVDGVDELPESQREDARTWLKGLVELFPNARYVVTSRPAAIGDQWLRDAEFDTSELQPMTLPDISAFVDHWHDAVRTSLSDTDEIQELDLRRVELKTIIRDTPALRAIATTPLLCALLCALNRDRRGQVPRDRVELYRIALEMLLERRDVERQLAAPPVTVSLPQKEVLLRHFAYWLAVNDRSDSDRDRFIENIREKLSLMQIEGSAHVVADYLLVRSGILREPVQGRIDFIHRTFQEYFAAEEAVKLDHVDALIRNAHLDQWQDIIVLAVGRASLHQRTELLQGLVDRGDTEPARRHRLHLLAVACLETAYELPPEVRRVVNDRLQGLIPPTSMNDARSVASAGEVAVPLLASHLGDRVTVAAACVRAIAAIGGDEALQVLARCASDGRKTVIRELIRAWQSFDTRRFAEEVLQDSQLDAGSLVIRDPELLKGLPFLRQVRSIVCRFGSRDTWSLEDLLVRPELEALAIIGSETIRDLRPLTQLSRLKTLDLSYCHRLADFEPVGELHDLEYLSLVGCQGISDFRALRRTSRLRHLRLGLTLFESIELLRESYNLRTLSVASSRIRSLFAIDETPDLALLELSGCRDLDDIVDLGRLRDLQYLFLRQCVGVSDFDPIGQLRELKYLDLSGCRVGDLAFLGGLQKLETLDLTDCEWIGNISVLSDLPNLKTLRVDPGTDVAALREKPGLSIVAGPGEVYWEADGEEDDASYDDDYQDPYDIAAALGPREDLEAFVRRVTLEPKVVPLPLTVSAADVGEFCEPSDEDLSQLDLSDLG